MNIKISFQILNLNENFKIVYLILSVGDTNWAFQTFYKLYLN